MDKQFIVRTTTGTFRSEHFTMEEASSAAVQANKQAEALGIEVRYEAAPR